MPDFSKITQNIIRNASRRASRSTVDVVAQNLTGNPNATIERPTPFGAIGVSASGEPYYGEGYKGYFRKAWAHIMAPSALLPNPSTSQAEYAKQIAQSEEKFWRTLPFMQWVEGFTGIGIDDMAQSFGALVSSFEKPETETNKLVRRGGPSAANIVAANPLDVTSAPAEEPQDDETRVRPGQALATVVGIGRRYANEVFWDGLDVLGGADYLVRKGLAVGLAAQDARRDAQNIAAPPTLAETIFSTGLWSIGSAFLNPQTHDEFVRRVKIYNSGSPMLYTMLFDDAKRREFVRRYENGEDAGKLRLELANPWIELAGSVILDPTTYTGLTVPTKLRNAERGLQIVRDAHDAMVAERGLMRVVRAAQYGKAWFVTGKLGLYGSHELLPTVGELLGLKVGKLRVAQEADQFFEAPRQLQNAIEQVAKAGDDAAEESAIVRKFFDETKRVIENPSYGIASYDATGRASQLGRTSGTFSGIIMSQSDNLDDGLETMQALAKTHGNRAEQEWAISTLLTPRRTKRFGGTLFSDGGRSTGYVLHQIQPAMDEFAAMRDAYRLVSRGGIDTITEDAAKLAKKYKKLFIDAEGGELTAVVQHFAKKLGDAASAICPTVDEMADAAKAVKQGSTEARLVELAAQYEDLPQSIKITNATFGKIRKAMNWTKTKFFSNVYLAANPAFPMRDRLSMLPILAAERGFSEALDTTLRAGMSQFSPALTNAVIDRNAEHMRQMLGGIVPESAMRGTSSVGYRATGFEHGGAKIDINALRADARGDLITGSEIDRHVVDDVMDKFYQRGMPPVDDLKGVFSDTEIGVIVSTFRNTNGNVAETRRAVEKIMGSRTIETWRFPQPSDKLRTMLKDSKQIDSFNAALRAPTRDDFLAQWDNILKTYDDDAFLVLDETPRLSMDIPDAVKVPIGKAGDFVGAQEASLAVKTTEKFAEARRTINEAVNQLRGIVDSRLTTAGFGDTEINKLGLLINDTNTNLDSVIDGIGTLRTTVIEDWIKKAREGEDLTALWRRAVYGDFSMAGVYPSIDPASLTPQRFVSLAYDAMISRISQKWSQVNQTAADQLIGPNGVMRNFAIQHGLDWDEIQVAANVNRNWSAIAAKKLVEANVLNDAWLATRVVRNPDNADLARAVALRGGFATQLPSGANRDKGLLALINKNLPEGTPKFVAAEGETVQDVLNRVPPEVSAYAVNVSNANKIAPAYIPGSAPTYPRQLYESRDEFFADMETLKNQVVGKWGVTDVTESVLTDEARKALDAYLSEAGDRVAHAQRQAVALADKTRDWILHDYDKTYADLAAEFLFMYPYWPSRTYGKMFERTLADPRLAIEYAKYRHAMELQNQGQPDWWKYNVRINIPGMGDDHPLMLNLEATLNPLNGLTGVDFDDPRKRVDWISSVIDDVGKFGPTLFTPIQWANAIRLYQKGQDDAAQRWMGRIVPQTQTIKAGLTLAGLDVNLGPFVQHNEFDPSVNFLMGGLDPYERNRVGRALATMVRNGQITPEQSLDAANQRSGPVWDAARIMAINERAPGQLVSFFAGVGFKPRTQGDMAVDQFYDEYGVLLGNRDNMNADDYRRAWSMLRDKHPFMDTVLLAKRSEPERDSAYAYAVLGRMMPGQMTDLLRVSGINQDMIDRFYEGKGNWIGWTPQDRARFIAGITDIAAILKAPDGATRQEWDSARITYTDMQEQVSQKFGNEIQTTIDYWFSLEPSQRDVYLEAHPEISQAMQYQNQLIMGNRLLYAYYGSISTIQRYYTEQMYTTLRAHYGNDIQTKWDNYYTLQLVDSAQARAYYRAHPELKKYSAEKRKLQEQINRQIVQRASLLPSRPDIGIRPDFLPQGQYQQELLGTVQPQQQMSVADWRNSMSAPLWKLVVDYWMAGEEMPYVAQQQLDFMAPQFGYSNGDELLRAIGLSMQIP